MWNTLQDVDFLSVPLVAQPQLTATESILLGDWTANITGVTNGITVTPVSLAVWEGQQAVGATPTIPPKALVPLAVAGSRAIQFSRGSAYSALNQSIDMVFGSTQAEFERNAGRTVIFSFWVYSDTQNDAPFTVTSTRNYSDSGSAIISRDYSSSVRLLGTGWQFVQAEFQVAPLLKVRNPAALAAAQSSSTFVSDLASLTSTGESAEVDVFALAALANPNGSGFPPTESALASALSTAGTVMGLFSIATTTFPGGSGLLPANIVAAVHTAYTALQAVNVTGWTTGVTSTDKATIAAINAAVTAIEAAYNLLSTFNTFVADNCGTYTGGFLTADITLAQVALFSGINRPMGTQILFTTPSWLVTDTDDIDDYSGTYLGVINVPNSSWLAVAGASAQTLGPAQTASAAYLTAASATGASTTATVTAVTSANTAVQALTNSSSSATISAAVALMTTAVGDSSTGAATHGSAGAAALTAGNSALSLLQIFQGDPTGAFQFATYKAINLSAPGAVLGRTLFVNVNQDIPAQSDGGYVVLIVSGAVTGPGVITISLYVVADLPLTLPSGGFNFGVYQV